MYCCVIILANFVDFFPFVYKSLWKLMLSYPPGGTSEEIKCKHSLLSL